MARVHLREGYVKVTSYSDLRRPQESTDPTV
jgi:hypothetical protein